MSTRTMTKMLVAKPATVPKVTKTTMPVTKAMEIEAEYLAKRLAQYATAEDLTLAEIEEMAEKEGMTVEEWLDLESDRDMFIGQVGVTLRMAYQNLHWLLEKSPEAASQIKSAMSKIEEAADVMHLEIEQPTCSCFV